MLSLSTIIMKIFNKCPPQRLFRVSTTDIHLCLTLLPSGSHIMRRKDRLRHRRRLTRASYFYKWGLVVIIHTDLIGPWRCIARYLKVLRKWKVFCIHPDMALAALRLGTCRIVRPFPSLMMSTTHFLTGLREYLWVQCLAPSKASVSLVNFASITLNQPFAHHELERYRRSVFQRFLKTYSVSDRSTHSIVRWRNHWRFLYSLDKCTDDIPAARRERTSVARCRHSHACREASSTLLTAAWRHHAAHLTQTL